MRIDEILVKKEEKSKLAFSKVQQILEKKLNEAASATDYTVKQEDMVLKVKLFKSISLQTVNQILKAFSTEKINIEKFTWKRRRAKVLKRGRLEIYVS